MHTHTHTVEGGIAFSIAGFAIMFIITFTYPVLLHPTRDSLDSLITSIRDPGHPVVRHITETIVIAVSSYAIAYNVKDLNLVFGITGSTSAALFCFVIPGMFYVKLFERWTKKWVFAVSICAFGMLFMPLSLYLVIKN